MGREPLCLMISGWTQVGTIDINPSSRTFDSRVRYMHIVCYTTGMQGERTVLNPSSPSSIEEQPRRHHVSHHPHTQATHEVQHQGASVTPQTKTEIITQLIAVGILVVICVLVFVTGMSDLK